tara:strand:+ start:279 stop:1121 length:843 start_codon:yes stop_codon:yes gene_type:complete
MILVLGSTGLLGNSLMNRLYSSSLEFVGTARNKLGRDTNSTNIIEVANLMDFSELEKVIRKIKPKVIVNCISLSDYERSKSFIEKSYYIYSVLPKVLDMLGSKYRYKYIHISTDGVFDGTKGNYGEDSSTSAKDLYGVSKIIGEPKSIHSSCIRTSIYGHSISKDRGILDWALKQDECYGFSNYFFSGMSTLMLSDLLIKYFIKEDNFGLFNIGGPRISKFELLKKIFSVYGHKCNLKEKIEPNVDLSLDQEKFLSVSGQKNFCHDTMLSQLYVQYTNND